MRWKLAGLLVMTAGCFADPLAPAAGEPTGVYGVRTVAQDREFERIARESAGWSGDASGESDIIGVHSAFKRNAAPSPSRGYTPAPSAASAELEREVSVLSARVERLERMVTSDAPAAEKEAPAQPTGPAQEIYQVSPDGRTAWISSGSKAGISQGATFQVIRDGSAIGQVQVTRVWPDVSELSVLWSNGAVKRGDSVVQAK